MLYDLKIIADEINRVAVGASVDLWGVPQLTKVILLDILEESEEILFYDAYNGTMIENLQYNPKVSLSITNVRTFNGRQVKGIASVVTSVVPVTPVGRKLYSDAISRGVRYFIKMHIAEIFDVIQKDKSLREAAWRGKAFQQFDKLDITYPAFSPSQLQPVKINAFQETFRPFVQAQLEKRFPGFVGTVEFRGAPNISPRFIISAEENFLLWGDRFKNKTFFNFSRPSPVAMLALDWETGDSLEFQGWGKFFFFGKTVLLVNEVWRKIGFKDPMQAIHFFPEEIYRVQQNKRVPILKGRNRADWLPQPTVKKQFNLDVTPTAPLAEPPKAMPPTAPPLPKIVMLSNEHLAAHICASLKQDFNMKLLPIEDYDRAHLTDALCVMTTIGNRAAEVDLYYLRALLDAAAFYGDANLERDKVKFIVFVAAFERSLALRALINALEAYVKTLNQSNRTKVELAFLSLPADAENDDIKPEIRRKVLEVLQPKKMGELNYLNVINAD